MDSGEWWQSHVWVCVFGAITNIHIGSNNGAVVTRCDSIYVRYAIERMREKEGEREYIAIG